MWLCGYGRDKLISGFTYLETHHLFLQSIPNVNRGILETEVFPPRKFSASKTVLSARLLQLVTRIYLSFEESCCCLRKHAEGHQSHLEKEQTDRKGIKTGGTGMNRWWLPSVQRADAEAKTAVCTCTGPSVCVALSTEQG